MKVSFFATCLADNLFPEAAVDSVKLLEKLGCEVTFNPQQTCCGQPLANSGHHAQAKKSMKLLIDALLSDDPDYVVAPSGSCVLQVKEFPAFFKEEYAEKAAILAEKTRELSDFIVNTLGVVDVGAKMEGKAVYHPSCHMTRLLGVKEPPQKLLENVMGLELLQFRDSDKCCGFGGMFSVKMPDLSGAMVAEKAKNIMESGAEYLIGSDAGCLMNIEGRLQQENHPIRVMHLANVLMHK